MARELCAADAGAAEPPARATDIVEALAACPPLWALLDASDRRAMRAACRQGRVLADGACEHLTLSSRVMHGALPLSTEGVASLAGLQRRGCRPASLGLRFGAGGTHQDMAELHALQVLRACSGTVRSLSLHGAVSAGLVDGVRAVLPALQKLRLCDTIPVTQAAVGKAGAATARAAAAAAAAAAGPSTSAAAPCLHAPAVAAMCRGLVASLAPTLTRLHLPHAVDDSWAPVLGALGACTALEALHVEGPAHPTLAPLSYQAEASGALLPALAGLSRLTALRITGSGLLPHDPAAALGLLAHISNLTCVETLALWLPAAHHMHAGAASLVGCVLSATAPLLRLRSLDLGTACLSRDLLEWLSSQHGALTCLAFGGMAEPRPAPELLTTVGAWSHLLPAALCQLRLRSPYAMGLAGIAALAPTPPQREVGVQVLDVHMRAFRGARLDLSGARNNPPLPDPSPDARAKHMRAVLGLLRDPLAAADAAARREPASRGYTGRPDAPQSWDGTRATPRCDAELWVVGDHAKWQKALPGPHLEWLRELSLVHTFLRKLVLQGLDLSNGELAVLVEACPWLQELTLCTCEFPVPYLPCLADMRALHELYIIHTRLHSWLVGPGAERGLLNLCLEAPRLRHVALQPAAPHPDDAPGEWALPLPYNWSRWWRAEEEAVRAVLQGVQKELQLARRSTRLLLLPPDED